MHAFTHSYYIHIYLSFVYMYSFLVTSYILLTYIFMYFISLSYLMTYTYTSIYLYVLLVLYQTVLSPIGVQNIDFIFNTLRYASCPNYLPFYLFLFRYTHINIRLLGSEIKNERDSVQYIPKVQYDTEQRRSCPHNRSVGTLPGVLKHWSCIRAKALIICTCLPT